MDSDYRAAGRPDSGVGRRFRSPGQRTGERAADIGASGGSSGATAAPVPTEAPKGGPDTDTVEQQDGSQSGAQDGETKDDANKPDNEVADAAALAGKATVTADQAKTLALAANPGATVVKAELGDENGVIVYSVELSTGADVKVEAQKGTIISTDQAGSDADDRAGDTEAPDAPK